MKRLWTLLFRSLDEVSNHEGCIFIGSRFALSPSHCGVDGFCLNIVRDADTQVRRSMVPGNRIACEEAAAVTRAILRADTSTHSRTSLAETTRIVQQHVIPELQVLNFGGGVAGNSIWWTLVLVDDWALREAGRDWPQWRRVIAPSFMASPTGVALMKLIKVAAVEWKFRSSIPAARNQAVVQLFRFYFRFVSLMGVQAFTDSFLMYLSDMVEESSQMDVFTSSLALLNASVEIESLVDADGSVSVCSTDTMRRVEQILSQPGPSSSRALLEVQIRTSLCPALSSLFLAVERSKTERLIRFGVTLIDFCSSHVSFARLSSSRETLASILFRGHDGLSVPLRSSLLSISSYHQAWSLGVTRRLAPAPRALAATGILESTLDAIAALVPVADSAFQRISFRDDSLNSSRALGRAIGIALLHGGDLVHWRLEPRIARLLHKKTRARASTLGGIALVAQSGHEYTTEQFMHMTAGLDDVLNPGGHEMFTLSNWMIRFGPRPIYL